MAINQLTVVTEKTNKKNNKLTVLSPPLIEPPLYRSCKRCRRALDHQVDQEGGPELVLSGLGTESDIQEAQDSPNHGAPKDRVHSVVTQRLYGVL